MNTLLCFWEIPETVTFYCIPADVAAAADVDLGLCHNQYINEPTPEDSEKELQKLCTLIYGGDEGQGAWDQYKVLKSTDESPQYITRGPVRVILTGFHL